MLYSLLLKIIYSYFVYVFLHFRGFLVDTTLAHSVEISLFRYPSIASLDNWLIDNSVHHQV